MEIKIYLITDTTTGLQYVGQTSQTIKKRFNNHACNKSSLIGQTIKEHGRENFTIDVIEICDTVEQANEREKYHIAKFNTLYPNGLNLTRGGREGGFSEATLKRMSEGQKRRYANPEEHEKSSKAANREPLSEEHKANISAGLKKHYSDPENIQKLCEIRQKQYTPELRAQRARESTGRKHTEETKKKQSESAKRRAQTPEGHTHLLAMNAKSNEIQAEKRRQKLEQQANSDINQNQTKEKEDQYASKV